jgi:hypothetical protein
VGLERGPHSLVRTIEELLERKSSGSGLEIREYGCRDPSRWPRGTLYPQTLALTSPTSGDAKCRKITSRYPSLIVSFIFKQRYLNIFLFLWICLKYCFHCGSTQPRDTIEELLGRKSSGSGLENQEYCRSDRPCWALDTLYPQKLALTSPTSGGRSVSLVCSRTKTTELLVIIVVFITEI